MEEIRIKLRLFFLTIILANSFTLFGASEEQNLMLKKFVSRELTGSPRQTDPEVETTDLMYKELFDEMTETLRLQRVIEVARVFGVNRKQLPSCDWVIAHIDF